MTRSQGSSDVMFGERRCSWKPAHPSRRAQAHRLGRESAAQHTTRQRDRELNIGIDVAERLIPSLLEAHRVLLCGNQFMRLHTHLLSSGAGGGKPEAAG